MFLAACKDYRQIEIVGSMPGHSTFSTTKVG